LNNEIQLLRSQEMFRGDESVGVIQLGININNKDSIDEFILLVVEKWVSQRMMSVPNTNIMIVTIQGEMESDEFVHKWAQQRKTNQVLDVFMKMMISADVIHINGNVLLDKSSLI
jgi:hypothetical protein